MGLEGFSPSLSTVVVLGRKLQAISRPRCREDWIIFGSHAGSRGIQNWSRRTQSRFGEDALEASLPWLRSVARSWYAIKRKSSQKTCNRASGRTEGEYQDGFYDASII